MKPPLRAVFALGLLCAGCATLHHAPPPPDTTVFSSAVVTLPAQILDHYLIVEANWDKNGPYHFIVDTGASATLVTPELAQRYASKSAPPPLGQQVQVRSSVGATTVLPTVTLSELQLGGVRFATVPALAYDCSQLSSDLGIKIDGVLGFPLFHKAVLTLDYPHSRLVLRPAAAPWPASGSTLPFDDANQTPFISVRLGDQTFAALIDSGSDAALTLNSDGLKPKFAFGPTTGPTVGTLTGDQTEQVGRLAGTLFVGSYAVPQPIADITSGLSALGGKILQNFAVTFDQSRHLVTFDRDATDPIAVPGWRNTGLSFDKTPAYWRVIGVIPRSPAAAAGVETGDLLTHIDGEPVARWNTRRYEQLLANAETIVYTFLNGTREIDKRIAVGELVP